MSDQGKLTALLHELQHARSPLARARVMARAWRTVRELSPTDRRLLARNAGFDGAEEILEGLAKPKGGFAPAMLLQALANARASDGSAVTELLAAIRDPQRRDEAIVRGADFVSDLFAESDTAEAGKEVGNALEELQAVEESIVETPEEALAALNALEADHVEKYEAAPEPETDDTHEGGASPPPKPAAGPQIDPEFEPAAEPEPVPEPEPEPKPPPPPPVVDWSRWHSTSKSTRPAPSPRPESRPSISDVGSRRFEARAVMGAMGAEQSVFSQLRVLRRELSGFAGSSLETLHELIEAFPEGWARRRALYAILEAGIPAEAQDALDLISSLDRELDRRWCLGLLARRGDLKGNALRRALDLVESKFARNRLAAAAG